VGGKVRVGAADGSSVDFAPPHPVKVRVKIAANARAVRIPANARAVRD
jgi:hypothetical protein